MGCYLIDFENVNNKGLEGWKSLSKSDKVIVFYSDSASTIDIDFTLDCKAKVKLIKAITGTANALDFQLVGYLFYKLNKKKKYFIISKDNGYTAILEMAKKYGACVSVHKSIVEACDFENKEDKKLKKTTQIIGNKVVALNNRQSIEECYGISINAFEELSDIICKAIGAQPVPDTIRIVVAGLKNCSGKSDFYLHCIRTMGQQPGQGFYSSIKKKYTQMKEIVDRAS